MYYYELGYSSYSDYTRNDPEWRKKRTKFKSDPTIPYKCNVCGLSGRDDEGIDRELSLHHRDYTYLSQERYWTDVIWLCQDCHNRVHFPLHGGKTLLKRKYLFRREMFLKYTHWLRTFSLGEWIDDVFDIDGFLEFFGLFSVLVALVFILFTSMNTFLTPPTQ